MLWSLALLACADRAPDEPVSGTYRIIDPSERYAEAAGGTGVIDGNLMVFEYRDVNGTAWKVTYVRREADSGADSATK